MEVKKREGQRGQGLVEFALILTLLLTFLFVIIEAGRVFQAWVTVQNSARSAARYALTGQFNDTGVFDSPDCPPGTPPAEWQVCSVMDEALESAAGLNIDPDAGLTDPRAFGANVFHFVEITSTGKLTVTEGVAPPGKPTRVQVYYNVEIITPFFRVITDKISVVGQVEVVTEDYDQITPGDTGGGAVSDNPPSPPLPTEADIVVNKRGPTGEVHVNDIVTYYIDVWNTGAFGVPKVTVIDMLPSETITVTGWTVTSGGNPVDSATCVIDPDVWEIDCVIPFLPSGQLATVSVDLTLAPAVFNLEIFRESAFVTNTVEVFNQTKTLDPDLTNNKSFTTTLVRPWVDIELRKTGTPSQVILGDDVAYVFEIANAGPTTGKNITITDTIPAGLSVVSYNFPGGTCPQFGSVVKCNLESLTPGQISTLVITATAILPGLQINNAVASDSHRTDLDRGWLINSGDPDQRDTTTTTVLAPDFIIEKDGPVEVYDGTPITFTVNVTNSGNAAATGVHFTDTMFLDTGLGISGTWTVSDPCAQTGSGIQFTCELTKSIEIDGTESFVIVVTPTLTTTVDSGVFNNLIEISSNSDLENASDDHDVDVRRVYDLGITKSAPGSVYVDELIRYTITVTNYGPMTAYNFSVQDEIDPDISGTISTTVPTCPGTLTDTLNGFNCEVLELAPGNSVVLNFEVSAPSAGEITNFVSVSDYQNSGNNTDEVETVIDPVADLELLPPSVITGTGVITYEFDIHNIGPSAAENISVTNIVSGNISSVSMYNGGGECGFASGSLTGTTSVTCPFSGSIPSTGIDSFVVSVSYFTYTVSIGNSAVVSSTTYDKNPGNNSQSTSDPIAFAENIFVVSDQPTIDSVFAVNSVVSYRYVFHHEKLNETDRFSKNRSV